MNIPVGLGGWIGASLQGYVYGNFGEKAVLAQKYLCEKTEFLQNKVWDGKVSSLDEVTGVARTEAFATLQDVTGLDAVQATELLWNTYNPQYKVWIPFACIGVAAIIALVVFARMARKWNDMNV